jgi:transcriptional regulator with XRE-family HTH domain
VWVRPDEHRVVGQALAELRGRAGVTQEEIARRLGKPQSFVSSYESGQRRIDVLELLLIVDALAGDPATVFQEIVKRRQPK